MNCTQAEILIHAGVDSELSLAERHVLDGHLALCPNCRAAWEDGRHLAQMADRWARPTAADDPGDEFDTALMAQIAARPQTVPRRLSTAAGWPLAALLCLATAFALLPRVSFVDFGTLEFSARQLPHWLLLTLQALAESISSLTNTLTQTPSSVAVPRSAWLVLLLVIALNGVFCVQARRGQTQRSRS